MFLVSFLKRTQFQAGLVIVFLLRGQIYTNCGRGHCQRTWKSCTSFTTKSLRMLPTIHLPVGVTPEHCCLWGTVLSCLETAAWCRLVVRLFLFSSERSVNFLLAFAGFVQTSVFIDEGILAAYLSLCVACVEAACLAAAFSLRVSARALCTRRFMLFETPRFEDN